MNQSKIFTMLVIAAAVSACGGESESVKLEDNVMLEQPLRALEQAEGVEDMVKDAVKQRHKEMEEKGI